MKCIECHTEIPPQSRYCLNCGASQPVPPARGAANAAADGGSTPAQLPARSAGEPPEEDFNWLAREAELDPTLDYEAQRRYEGAVGQTIGCIATAFFVVMGIILLIPGVPLLAVFGLPLALILGPLTYFNVGRLQQKVRDARFLQKLPGLTSSSPTVIALSLSGYLAAASIISILLMRLGNR